MTAVIQLKCSSVAELAVFIRHKPPLVSSRKQHLKFVTEICNIYKCDATGDAIGTAAGYIKKAAPKRAADVIGIGMRL